MRALSNDGARYHAPAPAKDPPISTPATWIKRALLLVTATAGSLAAAEGFARVAGLDPLASEPRVEQGNQWDAQCAEPVDQIGYALTPGACGANSLGMIDDEFADPPPDDELRVLALGDSITHARMYSGYLEDLLGEALDRPVEVMNAGAPGYAPTNELEWFRARGEALSPDLVTLQLCTNDYSFTPFVFRHEGQIIKIQDYSGDLSRTSLFWFQSSALYRFWLYRVMPERERPMTFEERAPLIDQTIRDIQDLARERGLPLVMIFVPYLAPEGRWPVEERMTAERIKLAAKTNNIPLVDLTDAMLDPDVEPLRRYTARATLDDLATQLDARGALDRTAWLRRHEMTGYQFEKPMVGDQTRDYIHPNFLGHYLMAQETADFLLTHRGAFIDRAAQ